MKEMICIKQGSWELDGTGEKHNLGPRYGEVCLVIQSPCYDDCYMVKGYETHPITGGTRHIVKYRFVPIMDISELEEILQTETISA